MITDYGSELEKALALPVKALQDDLRSSAASNYGRRSGQLGKFNSSMKFDADGFGLIRFRTVRYAYILNYGHQFKAYNFSKVRNYGRELKGSGFIFRALDRHMDNISDAAAEVSADISIKGGFPRT